MDSGLPKSKKTDEQEKKPKGNFSISKLFQELFPFFDLEFNNIRKKSVEKKTQPSTSIPKNQNAVTKRYK